MNADRGHPVRMGALMYHRKIHYSIYHTYTDAPTHTWNGDLSATQPFRSRLFQRAFARRR